VTLVVQPQEESRNRDLFRVLHGIRATWLQKQPGRKFWIFFSAAFFLDLGLSLYFFLFNLFLVEHGFTERRLGFIGAAMTTGTLAGSIPVGILAKRWGLRPLLLACFVGAPILCVFRTFFFAIEVQIALAFFAGVAMSAYAVCLSPAIARLTTPENRSFAFSIVFATGIGAGSIAGLLGGYLPDLWKSASASGHAAEGMRLVLLLSSGITMLGVWPLLKLRFTTEREVKHKTRLFSPFLFRFLPAIAVWSVATGFFVPFASVYFSKHLHMPLAKIGIVFSLSQLVQVFAVLLAPLLFRAFGTVTGVAMTQLATGGALFMMSRTENVSVAVVVYLILTGVQWMSGPGVYSLVMNRTSDEQQSSASAMQNVVTSSSQAAASATAGSLFERHGYSSPLAGGAGIAVIAALLLYVLLGSKERRVAPSV
jgi:MFS family permease